MTGLHDLIMMFFITMILLPMAVTHGRRIRRGEGGVLLALWGIYMAWRVVREVG
jgi:Ca2+/Na+ antiporter